MEKLARSYIEQRIQKARTIVSDELAASGVNYWGNIPAESAQLNARNGFTGFTASYLHLDDTLPIARKGEILAEAYTKSAKRSTQLATYPVSPRALEILQKDAQESNRIAQGLTRAAQRSQDSKSSHLLFCTLFLSYSSVKDKKAR